MEIPFKNTTTEFENEFKNALGYTDIDIPYRKIKPDLNQAATYLIKTIGKTTYDALMANYNLNEATQDTDLNEVFQSAIASYAYMEFAPANDLAHTPNGRRMRSSENEKTPFSWMLDDSNDLLQKKAFKAIDALIVYMDLNFDIWKTSDEFKLTHKLYVRTVEDLSKAYVIDSRLLLIKLVPGLTQAEKREIIPRIGSSLNTTLKNKIIYKASGSTGDSTQAISENEALLIDYIKDACSYYALSWAILRLQATMFPEGILQSIRSDRQNTKGRVAPQVPVIDQMSKLFKEDSDRALLSIEELIKKMFPPEEEVLTDEQKEENIFGFGKDDKFAAT